MLNMETKSSEIEMEVRDYECDFQGIVNNAVYQNYLEHARHCHLRAHGLDFIELAKRDINLVVIRSEIEYLFPLRSSDKFIVRSSFLRISRLRFGFQQEIHLLPENKQVLKALIVGTTINKLGKPFLHEDVERIFTDLAG
jgi:acyl-CoA thioester hydrolase